MSLISKKLKRIYKMQKKEFEIFSGMMYAEYCDEHKSDTKQMRYLEYTKLYNTFLKEEFEKRNGSISTIHTQE